jgi:hypothetical protein
MVGVKFIPVIFLILFVVLELILTSLIPPARLPLELISPAVLALILTIFVVLALVLIDGLLAWSKRQKIPLIFVVTLLIIGFSFLFGTLFTSSDSGKCREKRLCEEQEGYAIELIKIHESFVDELSRGKLFIRQSFFLVMTGLLLYYLIKRNGNPSLERSQLLILLLFATIICHSNEGILNYWQAEHLNKICILEGALDSTVFPGWFEHSHVYRYKTLPLSEDQNFEVLVAFMSYLLFTFSLRLNASSIAFYYSILFVSAALVIHTRRTTDEPRGGATEPPVQTINVRMNVRIVE